MSRQSDACRAIRLLVDAARALADDESMLVPLSGSTRLSKEGVIFALARSLETDATDAEIAALVAAATPAGRAHVVLSANVFTAPLRALAVARAAADVVTVRPSTRDPVFTRALLARAGEPSVTLAQSAHIKDVSEGEIHLYARDETIAAVKQEISPGVTLRAHGAGLGVALVAGENLERAAHDIADSVALFDQRGCLSPRVVLCLGDASRAASLASHMHASLCSLALTVPRGALDPAEARQAARYRETLSFIGHVHQGSEHLVGLADATSALLVPPAGRHVHVVSVADLSIARGLLSPIAPFIVALGADDASLSASLFAQAHRVRISSLGAMQSPRLDGPVDLRGSVS